MLVVAVSSINYGHLADQPAGLVLALVGVGLVVGFSEELWFRGIGRPHRLPALGLPRGPGGAVVAPLIFGAVHLSNAFGEGSQVIAQALIVSTSGLFFYLGVARRRGDPPADARPRAVGLQPALAPGGRRPGGLDRHRPANPWPRSSSSSSCWCGGTRIKLAGAPDPAPA